MNSRKLILSLAAAIACPGLPLVTSARDIISSPASSTVEVHGEVGLTYASGINNVLNQMENNFGYDRKYDWPVGLKFSGYVKYPSGFAIGASIGPFAFISVDDQTYHHYYHDNDYRWDYIIPVSADVRYYFPSDGIFTPYVRAGIAYPLSGGDDIGSGTPGPVAALGAKFWESRYVGLGIEAGYDASKVTVKSGYLHGEEKVRPTEFTLSLYASF